MKLTTKFDIKDKVFVAPLKIWGRVLSLFIGGGSKGIEYHVRYLDGHSVKEAYFLEDELSDKEIKGEVGFNNKSE